MSRHGPPPDEHATAYDPQTESFHVQHDWAKRPSVGTTIIEALSVLDGVEVEEYPPLYDVIDIDALDTLFETRSGDGGLTRIHFEYSGRTISVYDSGAIVIEAPEPPTS